jgi:hypothetical protein
MVYDVENQIYSQKNVINVLIHIWIFYERFDYLEQVCFHNDMKMKLVRGLQYVVIT